MFELDLTLYDSDDSDGKELSVDLRPAGVGLGSRTVTLENSVVEPSPVLQAADGNAEVYSSAVKVKFVDDGEAHILNLRKVKTYIS